MKTKHLMRFIAISCLLACYQSVFACAWMETHNYYLFHVYDAEGFRSRVDRISRDNWRVYLGSDEDYYYFRADEVKDFARKKGDDLMLSYVNNLERYLQCSDEVVAESWDYPSKADVAQRNKVLNSVLQYAQSKLTSRLRSQHGLLVMRCNMLLGKHTANITFWEQTASKYIESVYKEMMKNIYAGALYKTGQAARAAQIFAEQGDWESLMTQFYLKRSYAAIRQEYLRDPNSAVLPFLVQDFVNNTQEAVDEDGYGKLFVRDISTREAEQMVQFAGQVVKEGKTKTPALWMTARAWIEYLLGNRVQAVSHIDEAVTLDGTDWMKNCARVIRLYIRSAQNQVNPQFDTYLGTELAWMQQMSEQTHEAFYENALDRIVHQHLADKYAKAGRIETSMGLLAATHAYEYEGALDTLEVHSLLSYIDYFNNPSANALDRYLKPRITFDSINLDDLIGTKYLRLCQWDEAIPWLKKVPMSYYNSRGYAIYAARRKPDVEPWIKRQWLPLDAEYGYEEQHMTVNPKIAFATDMRDREAELRKLKGKAYQQACYDLAVRYAQCSFTGDCWFLMRNGKSEYDEVRANETDFNAKAVGLLRRASQTTDVQLKERALFALSYAYLNPDRWFEEKWNRTTSKFDANPQPQTLQYKAFAALIDFEQTNSKGVSTYVSRCDEYIQFRKYYKN